MNLDEIRRRLSGQMPDVIASLRAKATEHVIDAPRREAGYSIHNAGGDEAVVRIYDEIWWLGVNAQDFTAELDTITAPRMLVEINSPGGDVFDGIAIYNALRLHPAEVTTRVDGLAASIASVIAQAGDKRVMVASSQMMIHNAWGMTIGNRTDHEDMAALLDQQDEIIAGIYATASGKDADHFRGLMDAETWFTPEAAVAAGLADEVLSPTKTSARATLVEEITAAVAAVDRAVSSAEAVAAVRAESGKPLTVVALESLVGLRDQIVRVDGLIPSAEPSVSDPEVEEKRAALARRLNDFRVTVPPQYLGTTN
jgi:ATP-dependent protease ClpP protease subunit